MIDVLHDRIVASRPAGDWRPRGPSCESRSQRAGAARPPRWIVDSPIPHADAAEPRPPLDGQSPADPRSANSDLPTGVDRVLDAAANRAAEGLRVVEDYVRFVLDDAHLTGLCKQLRHDLAEALGRIDVRQRLAARQTQHDVGTELTSPQERMRLDAAGVARANLERAHQALRTLEEFAKLRDADLAEQLKQLRYRAYTVDSAVASTHYSLERLSGVRLYVLVDGGSDADHFVALVEQIVAAGAQAIQLRDKRLGDRELLARARLLRCRTRSAGVLFVMNDRPDLAVLADADGVHVGQDELAARDARRIVGPNRLVGVSTHALEQARQAVLAGADYIGVGPVFSSATKHFAELPGVELVRAVMSEIRLPAFAIGGIGPTNVAQVLDAGATRIAVAGAVAGANDPCAAARRLLAVLPPL
jgi:thiamine-phosphate pyrophosphorylase